MAATDSLFFKVERGTAFEFHSIKVISVPENRNFNTIKLFTACRELIYLRPEGLSLPENHLLLLRGPKVPVLSGVDEAVIVIGDKDWRWRACFDAYDSREFGIQSRIVKDPQFPEAAVEITFESIVKPAQANFNIKFNDIRNKDREIKITKGVIFSIANLDGRTKRVLRCFGDDLTAHMLPSEIPKSKKNKPDPPALVSGDSIALYRYHTVMSAKSDLIIALDLELEIVSVADGADKRTIQFTSTASSRAPEDPDWLARREFNPLAIEQTKEINFLKIDDFANIQVDISWFNDDRLALHPDNDGSLWGYQDGDCDYKDYVWADPQEIDWDNYVEEELQMIP